MFYFNQSTFWSDDVQNARNDNDEALRACANDIRGAFSQYESGLINLTDLITTIEPDIQYAKKLIKNNNRLKPFLDVEGHTKFINEDDFTEEVTEPYLENAISIDEHSTIMPHIDMEAVSDSLQEVRYSKIETDSDDVFYYADD